MDEDDSNGNGQSPQPPAGDVGPRLMLHNTNKLSRWDLEVCDVSVLHALSSFPSAHQTVAISITSWELGVAPMQDFLQARQQRLQLVALSLGHPDRPQHLATRLQGA